MSDVYIFSEADLDVYATEGQAAAARAVAQHGGLRKAARALGMHHSTLADKLHALRRAVDGRVPRCAVVGKITQQLDAEGRVERQWVRSTGRAETLAEIREQIEEELRAPRPSLAKLRAPKRTDADLLACYLLPDLHIGMVAWAEEAGEDWDLKIAREALRRNFGALVVRTQPAERALLLIPGDLIHSNSKQGATAAGTRVDVDTRYPRVAREVVSFLRYACDLLLQKHRAVVVDLVPGNHDEDAAMLLQIALGALYEQEPRCIVSQDVATFRAHRHGRCLIATCHGHTIKHRQLESLMASQWPRDWGETQHRHWYVGHVHHDTVAEHRGCTVETLRTIAPKDAWHAAQGYRSSRDLKCDLWHKELGRLDRLIEPYTPSAREKTR
jgi:hypothetical protein